MGISMKYITNNIFETHRHAHQLEQTSFGVLVAEVPWFFEN